MRRLVGIGEPGVNLWSLTYDLQKKTAENDFILLHVMPKVLRAARSLPYVIDDFHEFTGIW
jgi:hypothetical protein